MAFKMDGEFILAASCDEVWQGLNDPDVLCRCIQGCQRMEKVGDSSFVAEVKMKIGPVSSVFSGKVDLLDLDPPNGYRIQGSGDGGAAGFAKGGAAVKLSNAEGGTLLHYDVDVDIGGRLAQLGGRLINGVAKKQADLFFKNFAMQFSGDAAPAAKEVSAPVQMLTAAATPAVSPAVTQIPIDRSAPWAWLVALTLAVLSGFLLGRSAAGDWWVVVMIALAVASAGAGYSARRC